MTVFYGGRDINKRKLLLVFSGTFLVLIYIFQNFNYASFLFGSSIHPYLSFSINKGIRLTVNDSLCLVIIYCLFNDSKLVKLGSYIQLIEMFIVFPFYLIVKLYFEGDTEISSPLLSQLHRLIVNPLVMIIFIAAVYLKRNK